MLASRLLDLKRCEQKPVCVTDAVVSAVQGDASDLIRLDHSNAMSELPKPARPQEPLDLSMLLEVAKIMPSTAHSRKLTPSQVLCAAHAVVYGQIRLPRLCGRKLIAECVLQHLAATQELPVVRYPCTTPVGGPHVAVVVLAPACVVPNSAQTVIRIDPAIGHTSLSACVWQDLRYLDKTCYLLARCREQNTVTDLWKRVDKVIPLLCWLEDVAATDWVGVWKTHTPANHVRLAGLVWSTPRSLDLTQLSPNTLLFVARDQIRKACVRICRDLTDTARLCAQSLSALRNLVQFWNVVCNPSTSDYMPDRKVALTATLSASVTPTGVSFSCGPATVHVRRDNAMHCLGDLWSTLDQLTGPTLVVMPDTAPLNEEALSLVFSIPCRVLGKAHRPEPPCNLVTPARREPDNPRDHVVFLDGVSRYIRWYKYKP